MKILVAYYSRTEYTEKLAEVLADELRARGHIVVMERIEVLRKRNKWLMVAPILAFLPIVFAALYIPALRHWWLKNYPQHEQHIQPLSYPDMSEFDRVCIGGPKWGYISFPVARYLKTITGTKGMKVGAFTTFCGPPMKVFEIELIFSPMKDRVQELGGEIAAELGISSNYHEYSMHWIFRRISFWKFGKSLESFTLDSDYGVEQLQKFCDGLEQ
jgi:hypothetical protein